VDYRRRAQLLYAGWSGNTSRIKDLDRNDVAEVPDKDGHDALKWAVANMHFEFAQTLLSFANAQAFLDPVDDLNWESIHYACSNGDEDMITLFHESTLKVDSSCSARGPHLHFNSIVRPIHLAAASPGSLVAVQVLDKAKVTLGIPDSSGYDAMHWAVQSNNVPTMEYLKAQGLKIDPTDNHGTKPIHIAADRGYVDVVRWLIRSGGKALEPDGDGYLPVHLAAKNGHLGVIQYLRDGAGMLVAVGYDARYNYSLLHHQKTGNHPLHFAAQHGRIDVVRYLIQISGRVDPTNSNYDTPLHLAVDKGQIEVIRYLVEKGASLEDIRGRSGTPLQRAVRCNKIDLIRYLIELGAKVNAGYYSAFPGATPLHIAAREGHVEGIRVLKESGADLEKLDSDKRTALHVAAMYGRVAAARELKTMGANLTKKDRIGRTPSKCAMKEGHLDLAAELAPLESGKRWYNRFVNCTHQCPNN
jgi:ankyrin repeat protein